MNVVDSSAWLEYYSNGPNAGIFASAIETFDSLIVPSIVVYEVHKYARRQAEEHPVKLAVSQIEKARVILLDASIAKYAADISLELGLAMADSIILATARTFNATVWTQDADFEGTEGAEYHPKRG